MSQPILVTGSTGLIGSHVVAALVDARLPVRVFVRDPAKFERVLEGFSGGARIAAACDVRVGSLTDGASIRSALEGAGGLLHAAGRFSPERDAEALLFETNVEGTRRVLDAAAACPSLSRILYMSSILALDPGKASVMRASDPIAKPNSMYARTKAGAEVLAREARERLPLQIVYPAAVQGPEDPTFSIGPQLVRDALVRGEVLVTDGGLAYTDVRDLAKLVVALFEGRSQSPGIMGPSFYVPHAEYHAILEALSGRTLRARRIPGWLLRGLGRLGDLAQRLGRSSDLTYEAATVLTRSVPSEDTEARALLSAPPVEARESFADLIEWMVRAGHLMAEAAGREARTSRD